MDDIVRNGAFYIIVLVFSFLHECAHAFAAARAGGGGRMGLRGVFGNVLYLEPGLSPGRRAAVYAAGPLFNVFCAAAGTAAALLVRGGGREFAAPAFVQAAFDTFMRIWPEVSVQPDVFTTYIYNGLVMIVYANLMLAAFNMLPFYPLDGGRIAVLILSASLGARAAVRIAFVFSILFSVSVFFLGLYLVQYNIMNIILMIDAFYFLYIFEREINEIF